MTLRKREDVVNLQRKDWIEIYGELTLVGRKQKE
jgi:hypothetical protein